MLVLSSGAAAAGAIGLHTHEHWMVSRFQSIIHFLDIVERVRLGGSGDALARQRS